MGSMFNAFLHAIGKYRNNGLQNTPLYRVLSAGSLEQREGVSSLCLETETHHLATAAPNTS